MLMEQLCEMAYCGQNICDELIINEPGSFENVWKKYDRFEPLIVPQLKNLYISDKFQCPGVWSFLREVFPNCCVRVFITE
jgi:hypothetical protein